MLDRCYLPRVQVLILVTEYLVCKCKNTFRIWNSIFHKIIVLLFWFFFSFLVLIPRKDLLQDNTPYLDKPTKKQESWGNIVTRKNETEINSLILLSAGISSCTCSVEDSNTFTELKSTLMNCVTSARNVSDYDSSQREIVSQQSRVFQSYIKIKLSAEYW